MTTAGNLVFQGRADGEFAAYQAETGEKLWSTQLGLGISAPPITYSVGGKQYISLLVGWGGGAAASFGSLMAQHGWKYGVHTRRMFTFALNGSTPIPETPPPVFAVPVDDPTFSIDDTLAQFGLEVYKNHCVLCHGPGVVSGGTAPDLRESPIVLSREAFETVVVGGVKRLNGMPRYAILGEREVDGLMHYIRGVARATAGKPILRMYEAQLE